MAAKKRSKWWIVSTHVLTTGFAMPLFTLIAGGVLLGELGLRGMHASLFLLAILAVGYIGGSYYSLGYLKKKAVTDDWQGCTIPAVITFVILAVLGFIVNTTFLPKSSSVFLILIVFYGLIIAAFAWITSSGFRRLQASKRPDIHANEQKGVPIAVRNIWLVRWFNRWWFWNDRDSPSSGLVRRWRRVVFAVALLMPVFGGWLGVVVLMGLDRLSLYTVHTKDSLISWLLSLPIVLLFSVIFNWPFFVFGRIVTRRLRAKWPVVRDTHWPSIGGLIGLLLPYALGYCEMPFELTSGARDAGQGVGLYLGLIAPIFGVTLGSAGWLRGVEVAKLSIREKRDTLL